MSTPSQPPACPECAQPGVPIAYGFPSPEMFEAADAGRIALGGCVIYEDMPTWKCSAAHKWADESRLRMDGVAFVRFGGQQPDEPRDEGTGSSEMTDQPEKIFLPRNPTDEERMFRSLRPRSGT